jgi:hypothetical protein
MDIFESKEVRYMRFKKLMFWTLYLIFTLLLKIWHLGGWWIGERGPISF